jgi:Protoglobin
MTTATLTKKHFDENRLEEDLGYRFGYLTEFMGFGPQDVKLIRAAAPHLAPLVPHLVDAVYVKLFSFFAVAEPDESSQPDPRTCRRSAPTTTSSTRSRTTR